MYGPLWLEKELVVRLLNIIYLSLSYFVLSVATAFASDCASDPNECTPKGLCEVATEVTEGNKLWSSAATSSKHVNFAQELGMNCGVVELKDPCDTDPNECKINQLCEKATIEDGGTKSWNSGAEAYVEVAQEYGLECGVVEDKQLSSSKSEAFSSWSDSTICKHANKGTHKFILEAKRRGLPCAVIKENFNATADLLETYYDSYICERATYDITGKGKEWSALSKNRVFVEEAEKRGLTCEVVAESGDQQCSDSNLSLCSDKVVCEKAVVTDGTLKQKYKRWSKYAKNYVAEAKNRGLSCNVIKYDLKRYYTWVSTNKGYEGNVSIDDASDSKGVDSFYSWASGGYAGFWTNYDPDKEDYKSNAYTNTVFPKLTSAFKQKSKSDRQRIQRNLKNKGLYDSAIDGLWGRNTLVALTDYSSKRLRTIRLTDPQIVKTLMDQILRDTSSGDVALASSEVINEVYKYLTIIQKAEAKSTAFAVSFKERSKLERQQIQYALHELGYYNSGIDGLWGNGTKSALINFTVSKSLEKYHPFTIFSNLLSVVDVPTSFATAKKQKCDIKNVAVCTNTEFCKVAVYPINGTKKFRANDLAREAMRRGLSCGVSQDIAHKKKNPKNDRLNEAQLNFGKELLKLGLIGLACSATSNPSACLEGAAESGSSSGSTISSTTDDCTSDFSCSYGKKCVKKPGSYVGNCMTTVDEYGTKTYSTPSASSGQRRDRSSGCTSSLDCPRGFRCDREYKLCVK